MLPPVDGALARDDSAPDRDRVKLARKWAYLLSQVTCVPIPHAELESRLLGLVTDLVVITTSRPFEPDGAGEIGRRLVSWRLTDPTAIRLTANLLGKGLLALPELSAVDGLAERVVAVSATVAAGYGEQLQRFTLDQQESLSRALARAVRNAERDLRQAETRFDQVAVCSPNGIAITDTDGRFVRTNAALARILGYRPGELEEHGHSLFEVVTPERADQLRLRYEGLAAGGSGPARQLLRLLGADGSVTTVSAVASPLPDPDGTVHQFVTVFEDQSELTLLRDELCRQALHDLLTGLPNRQYYTTRLEEALHRADPAHGITVYLLDLDAFSLITAGLGREVSERLLVAVAERLTSVVAGESAMVARFEGDEFGILVENTGHTPAVRETVARILAALAEPVDVDGRELSVSASIGVVHRPPAGLTPANLLGLAELALRRAQRDPGRRWALHDETANREDREACRLAAELPAALRAGRLSVSYQPVRRLADGRPAGLTARLRWVRRGAGVPRDRVRIGVPAPVLRESALRPLTDLGAGVVATGFSTVPADLVTIAELPVSSVRIRDAGPVPAEPVTALLDAVHANGITVLVDGIGSGERAEWWRALGADFAEGDGVTPAGPADSVPFLLR